MTYINTGVYMNNESDINSLRTEISTLKTQFNDSNILTNYHEKSKKLKELQKNLAQKLLASKTDLDKSLPLKKLISSFSNTEISEMAHYVVLSQNGGNKNTIQRGTKTYQQYEMMLVSSGVSEEIVAYVAEETLTSFAKENSSCLLTLATKVA